MSHWHAQDLDTKLCNIPDEFGLTENFVIRQEGQTQSYWVNQSVLYCLIFCFHIHYQEK